MQPLTIDQLIERYPGTTRQSWAQMRYRGNGPKYFKVGNKVFYALEDILDWEKANKRSRTDEQPQGVA